VCVGFAAWRKKSWEDLSAELLVLFFAAWRKKSWEDLSAELLVLFFAVVVFSRCGLPM
jgi:hypothetical protein